MQILLKNALIIDKSSSHHLSRKDILIQHGIITKIDLNINVDEDCQIITSENLCVSKGWFDVNATIPDPGFEHREDILSASKSASYGGFTGVAMMPNTTPCVHSKTEIEYINNKSLGTIVNFYPIGAITKNCAGKDLTEMQDMYESGAIAFSDGNHAIQNSGLLLRSLEYVKAFEGIIFHHPEDNSISQKGHMHEGAMSIQLGLHASPSLAESTCVARDLHILEYTNSRLHFIDISTKESVALIKEAKSKNLNITASVNAYNIFLNADTLISFDSNLKVNPPLRDIEDINALVDGLIDGTIDTITSAHQPLDEECKNLEFDLADFGMIGFETTYAIANTILKEKMSTESIIEKFTNGVEKVIGEYCYGIEEENMANITFFDPDKRWVYNENDIKSKSKNTPFVDYDFIGKVLGIINKKKLNIN